LDSRAFIQLKILDCKLQAQELKHDETLAKAEFGAVATDAPIVALPPFGTVSKTLLCGA
jgi:hypothetical protein